MKAFIIAFSLIAQAASHNHVPPKLLAAVVRVESSGNCHASNSGSYGVGQVKRQTARSVGVYGNLFDCRTGIEASARYLHLALEHGGAGCAGISLYNRGVWGRPVCTAYGRHVMAIWGGRRG